MASTRASPRALESFILDFLGKLRLRNSEGSRWCLGESLRCSDFWGLSTACYKEPSQPLKWMLAPPLTLAQLPPNKIRLFIQFVAHKLSSPIVMNSLCPLWHWNTKCASFLLLVETMNWNFIIYYVIQTFKVDHFCCTNIMKSNKNWSKYKRSHGTLVFSTIWK